MIKKTKLKCNHCGYEWGTSSNMIFVTCPSCRLKIDKSKNTIGDIER